MKLMIVIVQEQDYAKLATLLIRNRIHATRFETSGLYSNKKNETLFICVEDEQQKQILDYIRESCTERKRELPGMGIQREYDGAGREDAENRRRHDFYLRCQRHYEILNMSPKGNIKAALYVQSR